MGLANFTELKNAIADYLNRSDLTSQIPDFITLAEVDMRRILRSDVVRASLVLNSDAVTLPAALAELRSVRFNTDTMKYPLTLSTPETLATLRRSGSGVPHYFAVVNGVLLLDVTPDSDYTTEIVYFDKLVALSTGAPTNNTLTNSPDIYLYGALKEAEVFLEHDERNPMWSQKYLKAVADENTARERRELGAAPAAARLPIVLG
jgi:hypothetical protein